MHRVSECQVPATGICGGELAVHAKTESTPNGGPLEVQAYFRLDIGETEKTARLEGVWPADARL